MDYETNGTTDRYNAQIAKGKQRASAMENAMNAALFPDVHGHLGIRAERPLSLRQWQETQEVLRALVQVRERGAEPLHQR